RSSVSASSIGHAVLAAIFPPPSHWRRPMVGELPPKGGFPSFSRSERFRHAEGSDGQRPVVYGHINAPFGAFRQAKGSVAFALRGSRSGSRQSRRKERMHPLGRASDRCAPGAQSPAHVHAAGPSSRYWSTQAVDRAALAHARGEGAGRAIRELWRLSVARRREISRQRLSP